MYANDKKGPEAGSEYNAHAFRWGAHKRNIEMIADFSADWQAQLELARSNHPDYCNLQKFAAFIHNNTMPQHVPMQAKCGRPSSKPNEEADDEEVPEEMAEGSSSSYVHRTPRTEEARGEKRGPGDIDESSVGLWRKHQRYIDQTTPLFTREKDNYKQIVNNLVANAEGIEVPSSSPSPPCILSS